MKLLEQLSGSSPKELRDKAMLELLYATGIRVSELIALKLSDINISMEYLTCRDAHRERIIPFGGIAREAIENYLDLGRPKLIKDGRLSNAVEKKQGSLRRSHHIHCVIPLRHI